MQTETILYNHEGISFKGFAAYQNNGKTPRPAVIVSHAWQGQDDFAREKAKAFAELGYYGFAADVYGGAKHVDSNEEAAELMLPLFINRTLLRGRITAAFNALIKQPQVDKSRIGAIGFCFGGLTVLELSRSGMDLKGVVSMHGLLGDKLGDTQATLYPPSLKRHGAVLILHGYKDLLVSQEDVISMQKELSDANVDWQMNIYGGAAHAFTNPKAHEPDRGMEYNAKADQRSWQATKNFFKEVFA